MSLLLARRGSLNPRRATGGGGGGASGQVSDVSVPGTQGQFDTATGLILVETNELLTVSAIGWCYTTTQSGKELRHIVVEEDYTLIGASAWYPTDSAGFTAEGWSNGAGGYATTPLDRVTVPNGVPFWIGSQIRDASTGVAATFMRGAQSGLATSTVPTGSLDKPAGSVHTRSFANLTMTGTPTFSLNGYYAAVRVTP